MRKASTTGFSFRAFAASVGFGSPNYLKLIIDGERDLTVTNIHKIIPALNLSGLEVDCFETLVHFTQASTPAERRYYELRLNRLKSTIPGVKQKSPPSRILSKWYYPYILLSLHERSVVEGKNFCRERLDLSQGELDEAVALLEQLGLFEVVDGIVHLKQQLLDIHDHKGISRSQREFLQSQLNQSFHAFSAQYDKATAKFISHTLTLPPDGIKIIADRFVGFLDQITTELDVVGYDSGVEIGQINAQFFIPKKI